ncbi:hypothetical protein [Breznakibacter xylanolyticus]|nr:hypothetical protein [Breznakibacter xylanolyticus]
MKTTHLFNMLGISMMLLLVSCNSNTTFKIEPPITKLDPPFTELAYNPLADSTFCLPNGTKIKIIASSLCDSVGNLLSSPCVLKFRQFDNAVSIFLAGMPMRYLKSEDNMSLETAGMFELRASSNGKSVNIIHDKPITITIGSNFTDTRQGFFKMDDNTGDWQLIGIPSWQYNPTVDSLKKHLSSLKPEYSIPLPPNFYVFDLQRMADVFLGDDYNRINKANMRAMVENMKKYGLQPLDVSFNSNPTIILDGNRYDYGEILWKSDAPLQIPNWVKTNWGWNYNQQTKKYDELSSIQKINANKYRFSIKDTKENRQFSFILEVVSHLRYLLRYTPEQLMAKQKECELEIAETERIIRNTRLIEYTTELYSMGVFNFDRPVYYSQMKPTLNFTINNVPVKNSDIKKVAVFNSNLTSVSYADSYNPVVCPFFLGTNKIILITQSGEIGIFTGAEFDQLMSTDKFNADEITIDLKAVKVDSPDELRSIL